MQIEWSREIKAFGSKTCDDRWVLLQLVIVATILQRFFAILTFCYVRNKVKREVKVLSKTCALVMKKNSTSSRDY